MFLIFFLATICVNRRRQAMGDPGRAHVKNEREEGLLSFLTFTFKCCICNRHIKSTDISSSLVQPPRTLLTDLQDSKWPQLYKYNYIFCLHIKIKLAIHTHIAHLRSDYFPLIMIRLATRRWGKCTNMEMMQHK